MNMVIMSIFESFYFIFPQKNFASLNKLINVNYTLFSKY